ncbi:hypothetical protein PFLUV_G00163620 [Perca fluviatilis]|uniref:Immunoglobulin subtype domain-containing protein n=1 Tax=Perca fluviatilis TaxID=8168 RepID=A0A6A5ECW9_PERFL|nr:hypothetical protein PFLUV_G00163620 [Perca fluviatilis]
MRNFTLITALLLCSLSWISVPASESHTVEVQSGGGVTLMCDGFQNGFEMSSNIFLKIKRENSSDSGLYVCGCIQSNHIVQEESAGKTNVMSVILTVLTVFLTIVIIVLAVKIRKLQTEL